MRQTTTGNDEIKKNLILRLNKINGQINGLKKMIEAEEECAEVFNQIASVQGALNGISKVMLENYLFICFADMENAIPENKAREMITIVERLLKR
ncbi:MAG: metal-sensitive transcriptional regulator [Spirochaetes bacterium]|nr:metal-sensitive transcriptional regulator [Spirochaetota bacterium]